MSAAGNSSFMGYANDPEGLGVGAPSASRHYGHIAVMNERSLDSVCLSNVPPVLFPDTISDFFGHPCDLIDDVSQLGQYWVRNLNTNHPPL